MSPFKKWLIRIVNIQGFNESSLTKQEVIHLSYGT